MRVLIDTHVLAWWYTEKARLSAPVTAALLDPGNAVHVSPVSAWEMATKHRLGKWPGMGHLVGDYAGLLDADGFQRLPITEAHALRAGSYGVAHSDPFDRLLAAQCEMENLTLVTRDPAFRAFPCTTLW